MNRPRLVQSLALVGALTALLVSTARGQMGPTMVVTGVVVSDAGRPLGGLTVQLNNQQIGPSSPVMTNASGTYFFANVPTNVGTPYVIEIRWGQQTIYRDYLRHLGRQEVIRLH